MNGIVMEMTMKNLDNHLICERYHVLESTEHGKKCKDEQSGIVVWLKPLPREVASDSVAFHETASRCEALRKLDHPNIARVFGVVRESDDSAYIVMEYFDGVALRQWMRENRRDGAVEPRLAMPILTQMAGALDTAHAYGEIHRRLTPDCILVNREGQVKILGYGVPCVGSENDWMLESWKPSGWEAFYRAPEQWRGQLIGPWTDVYALGCISYEMLAGHVPFDIPDMRMLRDAVLEEMPQAIISQSTAAQKTILRCLAKNGGERFRHCMDYVHAMAFEMSPTGAVPRTETGNVLKQQTGHVPNTGALVNAEAFIPAAQSKETIKGTTKHVPIMLPDSTRSPVRNTTKVLDGAVYDKSTSRVMNMETEQELLPWEDKVFPQNKSMSLFFKLFMAVIFFVAITGGLYFFLLSDNSKQMEVERLLDDQVIDEMAKEMPEYADKLSDPAVRQRIRDAAYKYMEKEEGRDVAKSEVIRMGVREVIERLKEEALEKPEGGASRDIHVTPRDDLPMPAAGEKDVVIPIQGREEEKTSKTGKPSPLTPIAVPELPPLPDSGDGKSAETSDGKVQKPAKPSEQASSQTLGASPSSSVKPLSDGSKKSAAVEKPVTSESSGTTIHADTVKPSDQKRVLEDKAKANAEDAAKPEKIVAVINTTIDGEILEGAEIATGARKFKTPCELEGKFGENRKVRAFYQDKKGVYRGEMFWEFNWHGRREIFIELRKMAEISQAEARLLPLSDTVNMEMLWVPSGSFQMGADSEDAKDDEKPVHTVQISYGFWLGKYEVTQEEYKAMAMKAGLDMYKPFFNGEKLPMENITREAAEKWCEAVTRREREIGRLPEGYEYRLPTEAEWEFAARGGKKGRGGAFSGGDDLSKVGWFSSNSLGETKPVGQKESNELGFCDMSGNVREWCHDRYEPYSLEPAKDPLGHGEKDVARGGSWLNNKEGCRVTQRGSYRENHQCNFIGFRVALAPVLAE